MLHSNTVDKIVKLLVIFAVFSIYQISIPPLINIKKNANIPLLSDGMGTQTTVGLGRKQISKVFLQNS